MKRKLTVHKLDSSGREVWSYPGWELHRTQDRVILEAFFDRKDQLVAGLNLLRGDRFEEWFFRNRWYSVFRIFDHENGQFKGWYCNLSRPARFEEAEIFAEDLALDLIVLPNRKWIVLDEDEFEQLALPQADHQQALSALQELQALAKAGLEFFAEP